MLELPKANPNENIQSYIKRLIDNKIIEPNQINLAIKSFYKK